MAQRRRHGAAGTGSEGPAVQRSRPGMAIRSSSRCGLAHAAACRSVLELIDPPGVDPLTAKKAHMLASLTLGRTGADELLADQSRGPQTCLRNRRAQSVEGARNFLDDVRTNGGRPRQVDSSPFVFGKNTAATPGKVVYRNDLIELIQYEPQTPQVHAAPLLCSPPWINKYYVMDLAPKRSFIEWAVQHNRTVFAISYRNATRRCRASRWTTTSSTGRNRRWTSSPTSPVPTRSTSWACALAVPSRRSPPPISRPPVTSGWAT